MAHLLLSNGAEKAKKVIEEFKPRFNSKEEYLAFLDDLNSSGDRIEYIDSDSVNVNIK